MKVPAVDYGNIRIHALQRLGRVQAPEADSYDDDAMLIVHTFLVRDSGFSCLLEFQHGFKFRKD
jgi:hypothetical protein